MPDHQKLPGSHTKSPVTARPPCLLHTSLSPTPVCRCNLNELAADLGILESDPLERLLPFSALFAGERVVWTRWRWWVLNSLQSLWRWGLEPWYLDRRVWRAVVMGCGHGLWGEELGGEEWGGGGMGGVVI